MADTVSPVLNEALIATDSWPALEGNAEPIADKCEPTLSTTTTDPFDNNNNNLNNSSSSPNNDFDDWEDIETPDETSEPSPPTETTERQFAYQPRKSNPKMLRHSASSPNLGSLVKIVMPEEDFVLEGVAEEAPEHDDESFSMVESVASVQSISTYQSVLSTKPASSTTISWKDKVAQLAKEGDAFSAKTSQSSTAAAPRPRKKPMSKSRLVVVKPMKRCAKSTGDLKSLAALPEEENDEFGGGGGDDSIVMGETDAMEFYHRKAQGAKGRSAGLRLRPDEAKRKQITMHKKNLQRQGQR